MLWVKIVIIWHWHLSLQDVLNYPFPKVSYTDINILRGQNERQNATAFKKAIKRPWRPSVPRVLLIFRSNLKCLLAQQASVWNSKWVANMKVVSALFSSAGPSSLLLWALEIKLCLSQKSYGIFKLARPSTAEVKWGHKKSETFAGVCEAARSTECSISAPDVLCIDCISNTKTKTNEG